MCTHTHTHPHIQLGCVYPMCVCVHVYFRNCNSVCKASSSLRSMNELYKNNSEPCQYYSVLVIEYMLNRYMAPVQKISLLFRGFFSPLLICISVSLLCIEKKISITTILHSYLKWCLFLFYIQDINAGDQDQVPLSSTSWSLAHVTFKVQ